MPLPKNPAARKQIAQDLAALWRLPLDQRREVIAEARARHAKKQAAKKAARKTS